ncbi:MAG: head GIN domain-containing protein [Myxococcota bacterium]
MDLRPLLTLAITLSAACTLIGEPGSGIAATETLDLPDFDAVRLTNQIDLELMEGDAVAGEVTCDDNLLDNLRFEVRDGTLVIDTPLGQEIRPRTDCFAVITAVGLQGLALTGSGDIAAADFVDLSSIASSASGNIVVGSTGASTVDVEQSGSGDIELLDASGAATILTDTSASGDLTIGAIDAGSVQVDLRGSGGTTLDGTTDELVVQSRASGDVDASALDAVDVEVDLSASGNVTVSASGAVTGRISGSGDVIVDGDPQISVTTTGSGRVR